MSLHLHPRQAPADRLRLWVGATGRTRAPGALRFELDGQAVDARPLRPLTQARSEVPAGGARGYTGVFEIAADGQGRPLAPAQTYRAVVREDGSPHRAGLVVRTLPDGVPSGLGESFRVLLASCFHAAEDRTARLGALIRGLPATLRPHLTLLMGDQVYLDLPTLANFPDDQKALEERFERDYLANWTDPGGYAQLLAAAPTVAVPDDHEYWNNAPHASPIIQNSWKAEGRERWRRAAERMYEAFQLAHPQKLGEPVEVRVPPLSFLLLDTRSQRREDRARSLSPQALRAVEDWARTTAAAGEFGVVVTGQSLFDAPTGKLAGTVGDWTLADYGDYRPLVRALAGLAEVGRPVLCLTGDVHWGRVLAARGHGGAPRFYEIITSPSSLVTSVGMDQVATVGGAVQRLLGGEADPWPRHSDPAEPEKLFGAGVLASSYATETIHPQKGNQVALLSFRRIGNTLELRITYFPVPRSGASRARQVAPIKLAPRG